jgi:ribulose-phosphate 3-epimerase
MADGEQLPHIDALRYDVHLMAADPIRMGELCARAGAYSIVAQTEAFNGEQDARVALDLWRHAGAREVGVSVLLDTPLSKIAPLADTIDIIQVMSIAQIGFQKQAFETRAVEHVRELHTRWPSVPIIVDGGVTEHNARTLVDAGASRLVMGSAIMTAASPHDAYRVACELVS